MTELVSELVFETCGHVREFGAFAHEREIERFGRPVAMFGENHVGFARTFLTVVGIGR